jgi:D-alanyl-D-alanine dipeptidase
VLPEGFTDLRAIAGLSFEIGYHRADNFTGAEVPGYGAPGAWLVARAANALERALADLAREALGLIVYDAYRPQRAVRAMSAWCEANDPRLLDGYISRESRHARGVAIDVGLTHLAGGVLPMGGGWDTFDASATFTHAIGAARANRVRLRDAMIGAGFAPYDREWWHFELPLDPLPPAIDVPYA